MGLQLSQKSMDAAVWCASAGTSHGPVSVCVCLSVTSRSSIETAERNELVFGMGASFHPLPLHCVKRKFRYLQNKGISLWNFDPDSGFRKFCFGISTVETYYRLLACHFEYNPILPINVKRWDRQTPDRCFTLSAVNATSVIRK